MANNNDNRMGAGMGGSQQPQSSPHFARQQTQVQPGGRMQTQGRTGVQTHGGSGAQGASQKNVAGKVATSGTAGGASASAQKPASSRRTTLIVVIGVIVAALAVWLLVWLFACNGNSLLDTTARDGQAPYKSEEEMQAELNRQVEEGMFNISIASVIQFDDGASDGTAFIENVPGNRYNMQVTITDDATGDVLYESGILKPNQFIENIALAKDLEPGTYDATATFTAMDGTTYDEVGKAAAKVTINVLG